jgi:hypothetical protein
MSMRKGFLVNFGLLFLFTVKKMPDMFSMTGIFYFLKGCGPVKLVAAEFIVS